MITTLDAQSWSKELIGGNAQFIEIGNVIWMVSQVRADNTFGIFASLPFPPNPGVGYAFNEVATYTFPNPNTSFDPVMVYDGANLIHIVGAADGVNGVDVVKFTYDISANTLSSTTLIVASFVRDAFDVCTVKGPDGVTPGYVFVAVSCTNPSTPAYPNTHCLLGLVVDPTDAVTSVTLLDSSPYRSGNTFGSVSLVSPDGVNIEVYYESHPKTLAFKDQTFTINLLNRTGSTWGASTPLTTFSGRYTDNRLTVLPVGATRTVLQSYFTQLTHANSLVGSLAAGYFDGTSWGWHVTPGETLGGSVLQPTLSISTTGAATVCYLLETVYNNRGAWSQRNTYAIGDRVQITYGSNSYNNFIALNATVYRGIWAKKSYAANDVVQVDGVYYRCLNSVSSINSPVSDTTNWTLLLSPDLDTMNWTPSPLAWPLHVGTLDLEGLGVTDVPGFYNKINFTWLRGAKSTLDSTTGWAVVGEQMWSDTDTRPVYVSDFDVPPNVALTPAGIPILYRGREYQLSVVSGDEDSDVVTYTWSSNYNGPYVHLTPNSTGATLMVDRPMGGSPLDFSISVFGTAYNGSTPLVSTTQSCPIHLEANAAPVVTMPDVPVIGRNSTYTITPTITGAIDPDDLTTYLWSQLPVTGGTTLPTSQIKSGWHSSSLTFSTFGVNMDGEALQFQLVVDDGVNPAVTAVVSAPVAAFNYIRTDNNTLVQSLWGGTIAQRNSNQPWGSLTPMSIVTDFTNVVRSSTSGGFDRYLAISSSSVVLMGGVYPDVTLIRRLLTPGNTPIVDAIHTESDYTLVLDEGYSLYRYPATSQTITDDPDAIISLPSISSMAFNRIFCTANYAGVRTLVLTSPQGCTLLQILDSTFSIQSMSEITTQSRRLFGSNNVQWVRLSNVESINTGELLIGTVDSTGLKTYETLIDLSTGSIIGAWDASKLKNQFVTSGEVLFASSSTYAGNLSAPVLLPVSLGVAGFATVPVVVSWTQADSNLVTGYVVQVSLDNQNWQIANTVTSNAIQTATYIAPLNQTLYFRVYATSVTGNSPVSSTVTANTTLTTGVTPASNVSLTGTHVVTAISSLIAVDAVLLGAQVISALVLLNNEEVGLNGAQIVSALSTFYDSEQLALMGSQVVSALTSLQSDQLSLLGTQVVSAIVPLGYDSVALLGAQSVSALTPSQYELASLLGAQVISALTSLQSEQLALMGVQAVSGIPIITIFPLTASVTEHSAYQFTAQVTGLSVATVTWSVDGIVGGSSVVGRVDSTGYYTAPTPGSHTITATSTALGTLTASGTVTVTSGGGTGCFTGAVGVTTPAGLVNFGELPVDAPFEIVNAGGIYTAELLVHENYSGWMIVLAKNKYVTPDHLIKEESGWVAADVKYPTNERVWFVGTVYNIHILGDVDYDDRCYVLFNGDIAHNNKENPN